MEKGGCELHLPRPFHHWDNLPWKRYTVLDYMCYLGRSQFTFLCYPSDLQTMEGATGFTLTASLPQVFCCLNVTLGVRSLMWQPLLQTPPYRLARVFWQHGSRVGKTSSHVIGWLYGRDSEVRLYCMQAVIAQWASQIAHFSTQQASQKLSSSIHRCLLFRRWS